jgi:gamma-glutamyltranspeptidase/glutathione hydrolase
MVVSAHRESSRIGAAILKEGGNAVDAAVATGFALAVCYPEAGNIGGGGFMIIRSKNGNTDMVDFRERAPLLAYHNMYLDKEGNVTAGLSTDTRLASGVPGTVDGLISMHSRYGILPFAEVIQPAIDLARSGFPVTSAQANSLNSARKLFLSRNSGEVRLVRDSLWEAGDILKQPELAGTLERIRDKGREGFYSGTTARLIIREMERGNGLINQKDLDEYQSVYRDPVSGYYRGYKITSASPPSSGGIILLQILGMLEPWDLKQMGFHSSRTIHLIAEAEKRAFADRSEYLGDPDFNVIPVDSLLKRGYLIQRMRNFTEDSATPSILIRPGKILSYESLETTHYSVVDRWGNAVAATTTLNGTYGNCIMVDSAGFLLNNQMDDFSVKPGVPNMYGLVGGEANSVGPGKRMLSSMAPVIVEKDNRLFMVAGSPGGSTIPTSVLQVIINIIDFGMTLDEAVDAGRFHHQWLPDYISYEKDLFDSLTIAKLKALGYRMEPRSSIGRVNAIQILPDGKIAGAGDIRGNNMACGY